MPASTGESGFFPITPVPLNFFTEHERGADHPHQAGGDYEAVGDVFQAYGPRSVQSRLTPTFFFFFFFFCQKGHPAFKMSRFWIRMMELGQGMALSLRRSFLVLRASLPSPKGPGPNLTLPSWPCYLRPTHQAVSLSQA